MADSDIDNSYSVVNQESPVQAIETSVHQEETQNSSNNLSKEKQDVSISRIDSLENIMGSQISNLVKEMGHLSHTLHSVNNNLQNKLGKVDNEILSVRSRLSELEHSDNEISFNHHGNSVSFEHSNNSNSQIPVHIRGMDVLPDGKFVAVDNKNKKVLLYNERLEKVGSYQFFFPLLSVVVVSANQVAITSEKILLLRVSQSNDITVEKIYNLKTIYDSICLKDDEQFVVGAYNHLTPARLLSLKGEENDFNIDFPNKMYSFETKACAYIRNNSKLVLTDRYEHTVYIYDIRTHTRVVVKDDQIKEPLGVTVGPYDTILVCSENTNSIVHISQTGRILSSYKLDMTYPRTICISQDKSFIVVTNACPGLVKLQKLKIAY